METETEASSSKEQTPKVQTPKEQTPKETPSNQPICLIVLGESSQNCSITDFPNSFLLIVCKIQKVSRIRSHNQADLCLNQSR